MPLAKRPPEHALVDLVGDGRSRLAWVPSRFATPGYELRLKGDGHWGPPWLVRRVLESRPSTEVMPQTQRASQSTQASVHSQHDAC